MVTKVNQNAPKQVAIETTLSERGTRYGNFPGHACITQDIKTVIQTSPAYTRMNYAQREALDMIAHKIGRICNGDPDYKDSWVDIEGYAHLVSQDLQD